MLAFAWDGPWRRQSAFFQSVVDATGVSRERVFFKCSLICILFHSQQNKTGLVTQTGRKRNLQLTCKETLRETDGGTPFEAIQKNAPISWRRTLDR